MGIQESRAELLIAAQQFYSLGEELAKIDKGYTNFSGNLGHVLTHICSLIPPLLEATSNAYEEGVRHLRQASEIYENKVEPSLTASGINELPGQQASEATVCIEAIGGCLQSATGRVLDDLISHETFAVAAEDSKNFAELTEDFKNAFDATFLSPDSNLTSLTKNAEVCPTLIRMYIEPNGQ